MYLKNKDGRTAFLGFRFKHHLSCGQIATIGHDIQEECLGVIYSLWKHQFPIRFHLSMLDQEQRGPYLEQLPPLVLETCSLCRELGVSSLLDRLQGYQLHCVERDQAAASQVMVPDEEGFDQHLQYHLSVMEQADVMYLIRWSRIKTGYIHFSNC